MHGQNSNFYGKNLAINFKDIQILEIFEKAMIHSSLYHDNVGR